MKPCNFPGRKQRRQLVALRRLRDPAFPEAGLVEKIGFAEANQFKTWERYILTARCRAPARSIRTKKNRSAFARLRPSAA